MTHQEIKVANLYSHQNSAEYFLYHLFRISNNVSANERASLKQHFKTQPEKPGVIPVVDQQPLVPCSDAQITMTPFSYGGFSFNVFPFHFQLRFGTDLCLKTLK